MILQVFILARSNNDLLGIVFVPEGYDQPRLHSLIKDNISERYRVHVVPVDILHMCQVPTYRVLKPVDHYLFTME